MKHIYLKIAGLVLVVGFFSCEQKEVTPPNILFVFSDDHTAQAWGIYGGELENYVKNDNIKRLANEGALLENAFCTNSICSPSRASVLTGQYSHINQVYTLREHLPSGHPNIAKTLGEHGYHTAVIGKWHLVKQPEGFDYFNVLPGQGRYHNPILKTAENWQDGWGSEYGKEYKGFSTDVITDLTIEHLQNRDKNKPFLMFCNYKATHEPFDYPERYASLYLDDTIPEPVSLLDFGKETTGRTFTGQKLEILEKRWQQATLDSTFWTSYPGLPYPLNENLDSIQRRKRIHQKLVKDFMRCGAAIDDNIGRLLDFLEKEDIADNTIVIYASDQGYFLGEHGFFDKRLIYEESLRMPFVIRYPKEIKGGQRIDDIILNIDFAALLADYAGVEDVDYFQGKSFRENLKGNTPDNWRKQMYYRYWLHQPNRPAHFGLRNERYKLALFYGQGLDKYGASKESTVPAWEFYDLKKDPHELHNAIKDTGYAQVIEDMKLQLVLEKEKYKDFDSSDQVMQDILKEEGLISKAEEINSQNQLTMEKTIFTYFIPFFTIFIGIYLSAKTEILKDQSNNKIKPYSFSRTQLMWWSLIVLCCFSAYYGLKGSIIHLTESTLILLGISLGTTATGRIIDNTEINNNIVRHQDEHRRKGFLNNILSDNNGISIHRFQALIFNVIFGVLFIVEFVKKHEFVEFKGYELGLIGISSATYIGLKLNENTSSGKTASKNEDDDLMDIDERFSAEESQKNAVG